MIAWKESAVAKFIEKYNIGYLIDNLYEINDIDVSDYDEKRKNAINVGKKIREGYFTINAIEKVLEKMRKDNE